ncbi:MAG: tyrosine-type recombinase/integrase [Candidatus Bathyarchaeia archaeon]
MSTTVFENVMRFAEIGRELQVQRSLEYWKSLEARLPREVLQRIFRTAVFLQQRVDSGRLQERVAVAYRKILVRLAVMVHGNLDDVKAVSRVLARPELKGQLKNFIAAYNKYREANGIKEKLEVLRDKRRPLPVLPPESTLQASLVVPKQLRWRCYFRLLYECGPRPCEPFQMRKQDINFDRLLVRIGSEKRSGACLQRELPISPLLAEMLRTYTADKGPENYVFTKPYVPGKPMDYKDCQHVMDQIKKQLAAAGYNIRGLCLYAYRHAFATRLYNATKDLALVSRSLGHRSLETTMIYIHLYPDQPRRFDVENCGIHDKEAISRFLAEGWELALQTTDTMFFKRPRWVP